MKKYSITKYSQSIDLNKDEWTSICDIGKKINVVNLSPEIYKKTEDAYVNAILLIANHMKINKFKVKEISRWKDLKSEIISDLEKKELYTDEMLKLYDNIKDNDFINKSELSNLIRLELREDIGGKIYVPYRFKIFIGYDYMMGVHSSLSLKGIFNDIENLGLNIYQFK